MRLAILGASGHGKVIADTALQAGWTEVVFFDDAWPERTTNGAWAVVGDTSSLLHSLTEFDGAVVGIGNNRTRLAKTRELVAAGASLISIVHPSALVSTHATVGCGTVVFPHAVINACAVIGEGCIVNTGAVVEHDSILGNFTHVSPNAVLAGGVKLGSLTWVGASASVRELVEVGSDAIVGMGAVVTKHVPQGAIVVGNPARIFEPSKK